MEKKNTLKGSGKVLFIVPYPVGRAPSQRFRIEQFLPVLEDRGIYYKLRPFLDEQAWNVLYKSGAAWKKGIHVLKGFLRRCYTVFIEAPQYKTIVIHREAAPLGPPVFEWWLALVLKKRVVYDFDDAIWIPNTSSDNKIAAGMKAFWKVAKICKWSAVVLAGNDYLAAYAKNSGAGKVVFLPTVVDTRNKYIYSARKHRKDPVVVGWTGSHSTLKYLELLIPVLQELQTALDFTFLVIADKNPRLPLSRFEFLPWNTVTEMDDLLRIDIGVMPLTSDKWSEGKCGFKLIQYMALGTAAIASPVGVNKKIVEDGINGFLCTSPDEWKQVLGTLITNAGLRMQIGASGRSTIQEAYSLETFSTTFVNAITGKSNAGEE